MRNFFKRSERNSRSRRPNRGVSAVAASLASAALVAGLASYPVGAQVSETVSTTSSAVVSDDAVTVDRSGNVDRITIRDTEDNPWDSGRKASEEFIWGVKRTGAGKITRIVSVVADGVELEPQYFGYVNGDGFAVIGIDEDAFTTIPPRKLEIEVETTEVGEYSIAEPEEVPTTRELSETGYGRTDQAGATVNPDGVGMARAASLPDSKEQLTLNPLSYKLVTGASGGKAPRGTLSTGIAGTRENRNFYLTELVINYGRNTTYDLSGPIEIRKNSNESCVIQPENIKTVPVGTGKQISVNLTSCPYQIAVWKGSGDKIEVDFHGPGTASNASNYTLELYGSYNKADQPTLTTSASATTTSAANPSSSPASPSSQPQPSTSSRPLDDNTKRFAMEGRGGIRLKPAETTGGAPYSTTATVDGNSTFSKAVVRISAPNSVLATEAYSFNLDKTETGVSFERRVVSISRDYVEFEVYPVKNGQRVESVRVPDGAKFTMRSNFSDKPQSILAVATIYGTSEIKPVPPIPKSRPDGADWLNKQVPNPEMPKKCGLKIAIVADLSLSLQHGDSDGFEASKQAATEMVKALKDAPGTKVGIYNFATLAGTKGTTSKAVDVSVGGQVNPVITKAINEWESESAGFATNWEAGLKQVQGQGYDVVYFITDGMPTHDLSGWQNYDRDPNKDLLPIGGAFVQATSLNRAILRANELKAAGTRIVPVMVDLKLKAGNTVERDYILKDILSYRAYQNTGRSYVQGTPVFETKTSLEGYKNADRAVYAKDSVLAVNVEQAIAAEKDREHHLIDFITLGRKNYLTSDQDKWTYGLRSVQQMGEDISGAGDTVRIGKYSALASEMRTIAQEIARTCQGKIIVRKQIVNANGDVIKDGVEGWEFSVMASSPIIDAGEGSVGYAASKITAKEEGADQNQASWKLITDKSATATITELQQEGFELYQRNGRNAVCTQNLNGQESDLEVQNAGATGFRVPVNTSGSHVATVSCVVSNTEAEKSTFGLEVRKVDLHDRNTTLSGARFEIREVGGENPQTWTLGTGADEGTYTLESVLEPDKEYDLVEVKAPTQNGVAYSLLTAPVRIRGTVLDKGVAVEFNSGGQWVSDYSTRGVWSVISDRQTAYLEVANVRQGDLPKTGGTGLQLPILLGGGLIAAGALLGKRKTTV